jgi:uncharacterized protein (TIGR02266 family)
VTEKNRRASPRLPPLRDCVVRVRFKNKKQFQKSYCKDISNNGIFLRTTSPRPVFEQLTVVLELPGEIRVELQGVVVHVVPPEKAGGHHVLPGMGVQFTDLDAKKRGLLEGFLEAKTVPPGTYDTGDKTVRPGVLPRLSAPPAAAASLVSTDPKAELLRLLWLCADATALASCDAYALLGLADGASPADVRAACTRLRALCDPARPPPGVSGEASRMHAMVVVLADLEDCLTSPDRRAAYHAARATRAK